MFHRKPKNVATIYIIPPNWHDTGMWNPSSCKTRSYQFHIAKIMGANALATEGAWASATMILTMLNRNNSALYERRGFLGCIFVFTLLWTSSFILQNTETKISSFWLNFHHSLQRKLSNWQHQAQPLMGITSWWRHFHFIESYTSMSYFIWLSPNSSCAIILTFSGVNQGEHVCPFHRALSPWDRNPPITNKPPGDRPLANIQWNLSITTTQWDTSLPSGAHLGDQGPPRWAPEGRYC